MTVDTNATPLGSTTVEQLPPSMRAPRYRRDQLRRSIVHLGVGGFHRAHLATYVEELCRSGNVDWSIVGAGVLPGDAAMAEALAAQDYLYCLVTRGPDQTAVEVIGSIVDFVHASPETEQLVATIAAPTTQIVSLTVTEGGYPIDDTTGVYRADSAVAGATSAFGILARGLDRRRQSGGTGLTVLSCDNIVSNGLAARRSTLGEAEQLGSELVEWIEAEVSFPNSMVDRITPATVDADRAWLADNLGILDRWPVVTEPFRQWVVEDNFAGDRLPLEDLDVIVTADVEPYELMKLRLLNAGHSVLAYLASISGFETVDAAMANPTLRAFVEAFLHSEALPVLAPVEGVDLDRYIATLVERFSNPSIGDQISRLCLDGTAKFPKFLLPTLRAQLEVGGPIALTTLALAGWCEYLRGDTRDADSPPLASDPLLDVAADYANRSGSDPAAFLAFAEVFGDDLSASRRFRDGFVRSVELLRSEQILSAVDKTVKADREDDRPSG